MLDIKGEVKAEEMAAQKHISSGKRAYLEPLGNRKIFNGLKISDNLELFDGLKCSALIYWKRFY